MNAHSIKGMNGILPIKTGFKAAYQSFSVVGGPYDSFPGRNHAFGVCVRAERAPTGRYNVHLPIHDFSVPSPDQQDEVELALTGDARGAARRQDGLCRLHGRLGPHRPVPRPAGQGLRRRAAGDLCPRELLGAGRRDRRRRSATSRTSTFPACSAGCSGKPGRNGSLGLLPSF